MYCNGRPHWEPLRDGNSADAKGHRPAKLTTADDNIDGRKCSRGGGDADDIDAGVVFKYGTNDADLGRSTLGSRQ